MRPWIESALSIFSDRLTPSDFFNHLYISWSTFNFLCVAWITNNIGEPIKDEVGKIATPFDYGAGHFRPIKAADPGLVYDSSYSDYVNYLCSTGQQGLYNLRSCPTYNIPSPLNLNYPSISILKLVNTVVIRRTFTNVAVGTRTYYFKVEPPPGVHVKASPRSLCFNRIGQKRSFTITVSSLNDPARKSEYGFGWYLWTDGHYVVRSPLVVYLPWLIVGAFFPLIIILDTSKFLNNYLIIIFCLWINYIYFDKFFNSFFEYIKMEIS